MTRYKEINPHAGQRTLPMLPKYGYVGTIERLVTQTGAPSVGFTTMVEKGEWEMTFEAIVLRDREMFAAKAVAAAEKKLAPYRGRSA